MSIRDLSGAPAMTAFWRSVARLRTSTYTRFFSPDDALLKNSENGVEVTRFLRAKSPMCLILCFFYHFLNLSPAVSLRNVKINSINSGVVPLVGVVVVFD